MCAVYAILVTEEWLGLLRRRCQGALFVGRVLIVPSHHQNGVPVSRQLKCNIWRCSHLPIICRFYCAGFLRRDQIGDRIASFGMRWRERVTRSSRPRSCSNGMGTKKAEQWRNYKGISCFCLVTWRHGARILSGMYKLRFGSFRER
jgi:hypothetical protein